MAPSSRHRQNCAHPKMKKIVFVCFILFSHGAIGKSLRELEKDVLSQFVEVYDLIRFNNKQQAEKIQELVNKDVDKTNEILFLKTQIQELRQLTAPATCSDLWNQGITRSQEIYVDSDGVNHGERPVKAFCNFPSNDVTFGEEKLVNITHCEGADCFQSPDFQIDNSTQNQIQNVIDASTSCSQKWSFNCMSAPLKQPVSLIFAYLHLNTDRVFTLQ